MADPLPLPVSAPATTWSAIVHHLATLHFGIRWQFDHQCHSTSPVLCSGGLQKAKCVLRVSWRVDGGRLRLLEADREPAGRPPDPLHLPDRTSHAAQLVGFDRRGTTVRQWRWAAGMRAAGGCDDEDGLVLTRRGGGRGAARLVSVLRRRRQKVLGQSVLRGWCGLSPMWPPFRC